MAIKFGPSGNDESFYEQGHKSSLEMPEWLNKMGLNAYEYQCSKGVKISGESAAKLGRAAQENGIFLSIHAPYFISLSSSEPEKRDKSIEYIMKTLWVAQLMGAKRIVVHSGSCGKMTRADALLLAKDTLSRAMDEADNQGFSDIAICPETMGKINQLGNLEEVVALCRLDERLIPTIDFGHLNSRSLGGLVVKEDFEAIFDCLQNKLGGERAKSFHAHYSRIEFTKGGEKTHHTFADTQYGPEFAPIAEILAERKLTPVIICESKGTMARDAVVLKKLYEKSSGKQE